MNPISKTGTSTKKDTLGQISKVLHDDPQISSFAHAIIMRVVRVLYEDIIREAKRGEPK